ncbi:MAG TPA: hypothetical protein VII30_05335 [Gemmatimonadaceae bacterium]
MLELNSEKWAELRDAYGSAKGLPALLTDVDTILANDDELWGRLCHQGDVYSASFAAVPHLVRAVQQRNCWSIIALIASIEIGRLEGRSDDVPDFGAQSYFDAIRSLPTLLGPYLTPSATEAECRSILAAMAVSAGQTVFGRFLLEHTSDMVAKMLDD